MTLVAVLLLQNFIVIFAGVTGGEIGLTVPDVLFIDTIRPITTFALGFMTLISGAILFGLSRSPIGLILQASGQDGGRSRGPRLQRHQAQARAFCVSAFFSGPAGALLIFYLGTASVGTVVDISVGVQVIIAAVLGRPPDHPRCRVGAIFLIAGRRGAAADLGELSHLRRLGRGPGGHPVLPERLHRLACCATGRKVMSAPLLEVSGLTKRFGGLVAVKGIGFDIRPGEILGLIGPNGSGKSTVMKLIMGIERPNAGVGQGRRCRCRRLKPSHRIARHGVGIVFQHSRPLHRQTVLENIKLALLPDSLIRLFADPEVEGKAIAIAERVGLGAVLHRRPATLPFADLRRMELAKAMARDPKIVLVDEPFAGLTSGEVERFLRPHPRLPCRGPRGPAGGPQRQKRRRPGRPGQGHVSRRAHIAEGSAEEVMQNETVRRVYLGGAITTAARPEATFKDTQPLIQVEDLGVLYGKAQALEKVSIHVHEGEFVSVVGLNGAGKTTLFNAISGLVPCSGTDPSGTGQAAGRALRLPRSRATAVSCIARRRASCSAT